MIDRALYIETKETYPYRNLAVEEFLMRNCLQNECILYLWQNKHTVVVGKNQNCWKECNVSMLENDGGHLVRRLSGGGAVYHDMGNLNFTFLVRKDNYNLRKQMNVIIRAMQLLGINAEVSGRNDAEIDGRKFSGNAFYKRGNFCYHHGTLLIDADTKMMSKYLNVSAEKLKSKGVESVKSRVANLSEFYPGLTVEVIKEKMREAFGEVYGLTVEDFDLPRFDESSIKELEEKFSSWNWKYGRTIPFQYEFGKRFQWGDVQILLNVNSGIIKDANVFSDAMDGEWTELFCKMLPGCPYEQRALCRMAGKMPDMVAEDLKKLIIEFV